MADFLQIPGEVEYEEIHSYTISGTTVTVAITAGDTANMLFRAAADGRSFETVIIMGSVSLVLAGVDLAHTSFRDGPEGPMMEVSFDARQVTPKP